MSADTPTLRHIQRPLLRVSLARPMLDVAGAKAALGCGEDEVLDMIGYGLLEWAWNIGVRNAECGMGNGARREIRILAKCVAEAQKNPAKVQAEELAFSQVIKLCLPHDKPFLSGTEIQAALNCVSTHVINLIEAGALRVLPNTTWGRGPAGSPMVHRDSFIQFLKTRRVTD